MTIGEIRTVIEQAQWNVQDLQGGTADEFARANVAGRLAPHLAAVEGLSIAPRFARDIERRAYVAGRLRATIERWQAGSRPLSV